MGKKKTIKGQITLDQVIDLVLAGTNIHDIQHAMFTTHNYECTQQHARRLYNEAVEEIRERHRIDFEVDYHMMRSRYEMLYQSACYREDWKEARHVLTEMAKMFGLNEHKIKLEFKADEDTVDAFNKMFE